MKARCIKRKGEKILLLQLSRRKYDVEYPNDVLITNLVMYGYNEWLEMDSILKYHKGIHSHELRMAMESIINKARQLKLVLDPASSSRVSHPARRRKSTKFHSTHLLPAGSKYINNSRPYRIAPVALKLIREPVHGMFYIDEKGQMCFMRTNEIFIAPTDHMFHLR